MPGRPMNEAHVTLTPRQIELARHALGLPNHGGRSYRNHFVAGPDHIDYYEWQKMVGGLFAQRSRPRAMLGGMTVFYLTIVGAKAALQSGERLDLEDFPGGGAR